MTLTVSVPRTATHKWRPSGETTGAEGETASPVPSGNSGVVLTGSSTPATASQRHTMTLGSSSPRTYAWLPEGWKARWRGPVPGRKEVSPFNVSLPSRVSREKTLTLSAPRSTASTHRPEGSDSTWCACGPDWRARSGPLPSQCRTSLAVPGLPSVPRGSTVTLPEP
jgi:hypothetical protein